MDFEFSNVSYFYLPCLPSRVPFSCSNFNHYVRFGDVTNASKSQDSKSQEKGLQINAADIVLSFEISNGECVIGIIWLKLA